VPEPPPALDAPATLSATGLYSNIATKTIAPGVDAYEPSFKLWSDGAEKNRWVHLPPCTTIDTSDMDHWSFPIGTRLWKEFLVGGKRVETRLVVRTGPGAWDWILVSYQWNADETEAYAVPNGVVNANGTPHDIPAVWECKTCHGHSPERVLGFGAVQLSHGGQGVTVAKLSAQGKLTTPYWGYTVPGNALTVAALGYLHANCGHCHNETGSGVWLTPPYVLRLSVNATTVAETGVMQTAVGVPVSEFSHPGIAFRIAPGDVGSSCVAYRMSVRGTSDQMPPFGTEEVDPDGLATIQAWIEDLQ
jgi:hypothetical protein